MAILDLRRDNKTAKYGVHKKFCSIYVQLSQLQTLKGVQLLEQIELEDINNEPHPKLLEASQLFDNISAQTQLSWTYQFNARRDGMINNIVSV